ncbi:hypothetical protein ACMHYB_19865 [Sorangium sp. So ce1128]
MKTIGVKPGALDEVRRIFPADTPVYMINLLRYRERAGYPDGAADAVATGTFLGEIDHLVARPQVEVDLGVGLEERGKQRHDTA